MARIEKTVFISYRRTDVYTALAVYENLKNQGYDVFFDYRSISSGDFEQIITGNIRARAHFLLILTPTALDRCNEPDDWLRREIELAIDEKRNIVPLFFKGFRFGAPSVSEKLTGKLKDLNRYNGLNVHEDYFDEAMQRVCDQFLSKPLDTVLHPVSTQVRKVVKEEQHAADEALKHKDEAEEPVGSTEKKADQQTELEKLKSRAPAKGFPYGLAAGLAGGLLFLVLCIWGGISLWNNLSSAEPESTRTLEPIAIQTSQPVKTNTPVSTKTPTPPTPSFDIGSTIIGKDGMTLLYVPAGEFSMGRDDSDDEETPAHKVTLNAFWIDQTEVTNKMYMLCVEAGVCKEPINKGSYTRSSYYGNSGFDNYPVIYVDWNMARTYCEWADRRLPTEAEWEKSARGTNAYFYPWGSNAPNNDVLNYNGAVGDTTDVGRYPSGASPYGALDMAGNVWEWVDDWFEPYPGSTSENQYYGNVNRVDRGGAWGANVNFVRSTYRSAWTPDSYFNDVGFRCAMDATP